MNEELQAAVIALLASELAPLPVYGAVPQDTPWPYVVCGTPSSEPRDTDSSDGALVRFPVRLYSAQGALAQATGFVDDVRDALHHTEALTISAGTIVTVYVDGSSVEEPSEDGKARETVVTVAVLVDDITTN